MQIWQIDSKTFHDTFIGKKDVAIIYKNPHPYFDCYSVHENKTNDYYIEVRPGKYVKVRMGEVIPVEQFYRLKLATDRIYSTVLLDSFVEF